MGKVFLSEKQKCEYFVKLYFSERQQRQKERRRLEKLEKENPDKEKNKPVRIYFVK